MHRRLWLMPIVWAAVLVLQLLGQPTPANATFPGTNGLIAFSHTIGFGYHPGLEVVQADGTVVYKYFIQSNDTDPAWSPDGTLIAFEDDTYFPPRQRIAIVQPDGSDVHFVAGPHVRFPAWSPSGQRIVFTEYSEKSGHRTDSPGSLFAKTLVTGTVRQLTSSPHGGTDAFADWSPDGKEIVFSRRVADNWRLYLLGLSGRHLTKLTTDSLEPSHPSWSPDSTKILYTGSDGYLHVLTLSPHQRETLVAGFQGVWSPDGTMVAYLNDVAGQTHVFVLPLGGSPVDIGGDGYIRHPSWAPAVPSEGELTKH
jgi:TolB protein